MCTSKLIPKYKQNKIKMFMNFHCSGRILNANEIKELIE